MSAKARPIVIVGGPTASGKSALALALGEEFGGTIVNADSMQVYRDLAVLTARPRPEDEARLPHRLYGVLDAADPCSAERWRRLAEAEIAAATEDGRVPILVGGTGLYFRALLDGLAPVPEIPPEVRRAARALHAELGGERFHAALAERDPETAARLPASDRQRLIRAYEVVVATGRSLPEWHRARPPQGRPPVAGALLMPPRQALHAAIDRRFEAMLASGALEEVRALIERGLPPELPIMKAVGVRELASHLAGVSALDAAVAAARRATKRYAKRQATWFRRQMPPVDEVSSLRLCAQFSESLLPEIFSFIRRFLLTLSG